MRKKILSIILCMSIIFSMTACGNQDLELTQALTEDETAESVEENINSESDTITLVYAEVNPADSIVGMVDQKFKEAVEELSEGSMIIDLRMNAELGAEEDVVEEMMEEDSEIDLARISAFTLTGYGGQKSKLLSLPYTFASREHFWNFADSELAQEFLLEPYENGCNIRGLFYGEEGFRHFFTVQEIKGIEDFAGLKFRVSEDPIMNHLVEELGASTRVVNFDNLFSALQVGIVDGAEQPVANYKSNQFREVANHLILDGHTLGAVQVVITNEAWNSLTKEQQEILVKAGKEASAYNRQISEQKETEMLEELRAENCNIIEVTDMEPWQKAAENVIWENIKGLENLYQQILDLK